MLSTVAFILFLSSVRGITPQVKGDEIRRNGVAEARCDCNDNKDKSVTCMEICSLQRIKKRSTSMEFDDDYCDYDMSEVYSNDTTLSVYGAADVCVQFKTIINGTYDAVHVSWSLPTNLNKSAKYVNVIGFYVHWEINDQLLENQCKPFQSSENNFILNSTHIPRNLMKCENPLVIVVNVLPLPEGNLQTTYKEFNCNNSQKQCFLGEFKTDTPTFEIVTATTSNIASEINVARSETENEDPEKKPCHSMVCKYAVGIGGGVIVLVLLALIYFKFNKKDPSVAYSKEKVFMKTNKDYTYVSFFNENTKVGQACKNAVGALMNNGLYTIAVNALVEPGDLNNYYNLGPRKFSELYMQNARYILVLVTKRYLELCDMNNNIELSGETRRVFEEIKYIDRAQFEQPCSLVPTKKHNILTGQYSVDISTSCENRQTPEKQFIAVIMESSCTSLPNWMKEWKIYSWPKDGDAILNFIGE